MVGGGTEPVQTQARRWVSGGTMERTVAQWEGWFGGAQTSPLSKHRHSQTRTTNKAKQPTQHTHTHTQAQTMQLEGGWVLLFWLQPIALYEQWDQVHARQRMAKATVWGGGGFSFPPKH